MGIRFYCPNGHKLNVKTFLAGKRGICPRCGARFEIPLESVRAPGERMATAVTEADAVAAPSASDNAAQQPLVSLNAEAVADLPNRPTTNGAGSSHDENIANRGLATPLPMQPGVFVRSFAPLTPAALNPLGLNTPGAAGGQAVAPAAGFPSSATPNLAGGAIMGTHPNTAQSPAVAASAVDPTAEAPAAVWYVRPASGGQFGPAAGDVMRQWLGQRRIGADSMVWREGWPDWKRASAVFPSLAPVPAANTAATQGAVATPAFAADDDWVEALIETKPAVAPRGLAHSARSKGKQSNTIVIVSIFLILLCVLLAVVMVTVYMRQNQDSNNPATSMREIPVARTALA